MAYRTTFLKYVTSSKYPLPEKYDEQTIATKEGEWYLSSLLFEIAQELTLQGGDLHLQYIGLHKKYFDYILDKVNSGIILGIENIGIGWHNYHYIIYNSLNYPEGIVYENIVWDKELVFI